MRTVTFVLAVAAAAATFLGGIQIASAGDKDSPIPLTADETLVLRLVNEERQEHGLGTLQLDPVLVKVARDHSRDMAERGYFDHLAPPPLPRTPLDRYEVELGRHPEMVVGENIGREDEPLMGFLHKSMMASPLHKANILDSEYVHIGVGIYMLDDGQVWVTEMFRGVVPPDAATSGT